MFLGKGVLKICSNFIEITLRHGCSLVNLWHIFWTPLFKNTSGRLLLNVAFRFYQPLITQNINSVMIFRESLEWSVIKRPTVSTKSTTSGQTDTTSQQTSTTSGKTSTTSWKTSTTSRKTSTTSEKRVLRVLWVVRRIPRIIRRVLQVLRVAWWVLRKELPCNNGRI